MLNSDISIQAATFVLERFTLTTLQGYNTAIKSWQVFCTLRQKDILQPDLVTLADFFTLLGTAGRKNRTIKTAKCALKHIFPYDKVALLSEPIIENIIQGIGKKPSQFQRKLIPHGTFKL